MTTTSTGDLDLDELLGFTVPLAPAWPPSGFVTPSWDHPVTAWTWELLAYAKRLPLDAAHFPAQLAAQDIAHRCVTARVVLLGVRLQARLTRPPMSRILRRDEDGAWGGVVEVDGVDLLDRRDAWVPGDEGRSGVVSYAPGAGTLMETSAMAVKATEGMTITRYVADRDGKRVQGSLEQWTVDGGEVHRAR